MTGTPEFFAQDLSDALPADPLSVLLERVRLRGQRIERQQNAPSTRRSVELGDAHMYMLERGELEISCGQEVLRPGDLALLPHGSTHTLTAGTAGARWITGTVTFDQAFASRLLDHLPQALVLSGRQATESEWLTVSVQMLTTELSTPRPGGLVMVSRILDLLFIQMLRAWTRSISIGPGWLAAVMDDDIGRAVAAIHRRPGDQWTVESLADVAGMARSTFAQRFTRLIGQTPAAYLAAIRLEEAAYLLRDGLTSVATAGLAVGYTSEAAFSRAFKKRFGSSPVHWRHRDDGKGPSDT